MISTTAEQTPVQLSLLQHITAGCEVRLQHAHTHMGTRAAEGPGPEFFKGVEGSRNTRRLEKSQRDPVVGHDPPVVDPYHR